jgi:DNA invertase Pin-like site-specific DNA recombinase
MKTIAYIRISTNKQDEASQRDIIMRWCQEQHRGITAYATDQASGALPWQERALSFALQDCVKGDTIVVSEISRIARSTVGVLTFLQACAEREVNVIAIKSGIKLDGSTASKIVVTVLAMAAEIERDLLRERTKAALSARKAAGLPIGRQVGAIGTRNKLTGRESEIAKLRAARVSDVAIANLLGVSRGTLYAFDKIQRAAAEEKQKHDDAAAGRQGI